MSAAKKRRLGRGLSSLVSTDSPVRMDVSRDDQAAHLANSAGTASGASEGGAADMAERIEEERPGEGERVLRIPLGEIRANPRQPRREFGEQALHELAESIRAAGVIQPIVVRPLPGGADELGVGYELIAGERRWRAAGIAKLSDVPAMVRDVSDEQSAEWALIENIQREDLNPMERAWALRELGELFELSHAQIGERVALDRSSVANLIRLTELEEDIQDMVRGGALSMGHARAVLAAPAGAGRVELAHLAAAEGWTVRRVEQEAKRLKEGGRIAVARPEGVGEQAAAALTDLERQLSEHFGTRVSIATNRVGDKGKISISFYGLDHFDGLMGMLGFEVR